MNKTMQILFSFTLFIFVACSHQPVVQWDNSWQCEVYPAEHRITEDAETGAKVIFVTTDTGRDVNLYFDLNCWFGDLSMMAFYSNRTGRNELFGYLPQTGEIVRLQSPQHAVAGQATLDFKTHDIYIVRENVIYQWHCDLQMRGDSLQKSIVKISERKIAAAPEGAIFFIGLTQSADGRYLSVGIKPGGEKLHQIVIVEIKTGKMKTLLTKNSISHIQFSKYNPNLLRFSHFSHRMWYIDIRKPGVAKKLHQEEAGELVTHEDWWVNDQITFCGAYRKEQSHVKVIDIHTGITRILGAGSWWEGGTPFELSKYNWWHASGSRDGRWVATDNWHGHIAIIDARTTHLRLLTKNHRPYGNVKTEHPHVGWAPDSKSVEFTSHKRGNPDVCIAFLPAAWDTPFVGE